MTLRTLTSDGNFFLIEQSCLISLTPTAVNLFYQCLVKFQPFTHAGSFLADTWPSVVIWLWASGRNRFRTIFTTAGGKNKSKFSALSLVRLCRAWICGQSSTELNGEKPVMRLVTDVGSELPLTSFSVTHPGLAAVRVGMFRQAASCLNTRWQRLSKTKRERLPRQKNIKWASKYCTDGYMFLKKCSTMMCLTEKLKQSKIAQITLLTSQGFCFEVHFKINK